jgi:hypothetical protein
MGMLKAEIEKLKGGEAEDLSTEEVVTEELSSDVEVELSTEAISHTPDNTVNKKEQHLHAKKASKNSTLNRVFNNLNK